VSTGGKPGSSRAGPELLFEDPCVVFALRRERGPFCREFRPHQRFAGAPCWAKFCGPAWLSVLVLATGMGRAPAERGLAWLLGRPMLGNLPYRPKLVVAAGYCGALQDGFHVGDIILATDVVDAATGDRWQATWPGELPSGRWDPPLHRGRIVTVPRLAATPAEKHELGHRHEAVAVDMETAIVARLCHQAEVPFGCLRAVVDEAATPLAPQLASWEAPWRLAVAVLRRPWLAGELWQLAKRSRLAGERLGRALGEVLTLTLPWAGD
jgi:adenosylhomocysteine nucleosidase